MKLFITREMPKDDVSLGKLTLWTCFPVLDEASGHYSGNGKSVELDSDLFPEITHEKGMVTMDLVHSWQKTNCEEVLNLEAKEKLKSAIEHSKNRDDTYITPSDLKQILDETLEGSTCESNQYSTTAEKALNGWSMDVEDPLPRDGKKFEDTLDRIATLLLKREDATSDDVVDKFIAKKSVEDDEDNEKLLKCEKISQEELSRLISGAPILIGSACRLASFISLKDDQILASVVGHEEPVLSTPAYWVPGIDKTMYLNPETFKDTETGLEWLLKDFRSMTWEEAMKLNINGFTLPDRDQLFTLVDNPLFNPTYNKSIDTSAHYHWSRTSHELNTSLAWLVHFDFGTIYARCKTSSNYVYLVRAIERKMKTFKDEKTGLEWLLEDFDSMSWEEAVNLNIKGFTLPTKEQLFTLIDDTIAGPACSKPVNILSTSYWSSTPYTLIIAYAWLIDFYNGNVYFSDKANYNDIRLVRPIKGKKDEDI